MPPTYASDLLVQITEIGKWMPGSLLATPKT